MAWKRSSSFSTFRLLRYIAIGASVGIGGAAMYYVGANQGFTISSKLTPVAGKPLGVRIENIVACSVVALSTVVVIGVGTQRIFGASPVERLRDAIPPSLREAMRQIEGALKPILDSVADTRHPLLLNLAAVARLQEELTVAHPTGLSICQNRDVVADALHWMRFASCAYGFAVCKALGLTGDFSMQTVRKGAMAQTTNITQVQEIADKLWIVKHTNLRDRQDVLMYSNAIFNHVHSPCFYIALDHNMRAVVLSVRGSMSVGDTLTDLVCESTAFLSGEAHAGIAAGANNVLAQARETLVDVLTRFSDEEYKLVVTGHSLGAGTAILLTMLLLDDPIFVTCQVECWAFAPPPVFTPLEKISPRCHRAIKCFVYRNDLVPRLSLFSVRRLCLQVKAADSMPLKAITRLMLAYGTCDQEKRERADFMVLFRQLKHRCGVAAPPFATPGQIYWMLDSDGRFYTTTSREFRSVLLKADMLLSHLPSSYECGLQKTFHLLHRMANRTLLICSSL
uniref:sn-1-specific diacylglycerol lipase n=1 Tax=Pyramimonas obovata TaxID=1411642 RepID=A0A7S0R525_9CHLO|mmetsp:Transcript_25838/g.56085  ORF Transcript_25838/g.56085 Transcript_25838/m.56085 type:complete len:509 (+) Transcript_25838:443-1969(+)